MQKISASPGRLNDCFLCLYESLWILLSYFSGSCSPGDFDHITPTNQSKKSSG